MYSGFTRQGECQKQNWGT